MQSLLQYKKTILFTAGLVYGKYVINGPECNIQKDMSDQVVVITGASSGVGLETAKYLAKQNAKLVLACRNKEKTENIINQLKEETNNQNIDFVQLQLDDWETIKDSCQQFKKKYQKIDILINNAGIYSIDFERNKQNYEKQFATNHMGHFLFTTQLMELFKNTPQSRVITLSSRAQTRASGFKLDNFYEFVKQFTEEDKFNKLDNYALSKLGNLMFTKELQNQFNNPEKNDFTKCVSCHPGLVSTELINKLVYNEKFSYLVGNPIVKNLILSPVMWYFAKTPKQGAQQQINLAMVDYEDLVPGAYYKAFKTAPVHKQAESKENCKKFWEYSETIAQPYM